MPKSKNGESKEGIAGETQYREASGAPSRRVGVAKHPMEIAVTVRQQTPEEERQCNAAIQLLLTELVRQQLGCEGRK
jgi:hypothetical protein